MDEATWLASNDPLAMADFLIRHDADLTESIDGCRMASPRKLRLFAVAVARALGLDRDEIAKAERLAESGTVSCSVSLLQNRDPRHAALMYCYQATGSAIAKRQCPPAERAALLRDIVGNPFRPVTLPLPCPQCGNSLVPSHQYEGRYYCQPCGLYPAVTTLPCPWLTPTVLAIARQAYDERPGRKCGTCGGRGFRGGVAPGQSGWIGAPDCTDCHGTGRIEDGTLCPDTLSVLADALEDAGCPAELEEECGVLLSERACAGGKPFTHFPNCPDCKGSGKIRTPNPLLAHLRSPGPHVRGCWVVDLILGKE